jgi:uncharacterized lipoprotein YmbA
MKKPLLAILLLLLAGCAGHTLALVYQYDSDKTVKVESGGDENAN